MLHTCDKWFYITTQTGNKSMKLARKQLLLLFLLDAFKIKNPMTQWLCTVQSWLTRKQWVSNESLVILTFCFKGTKTDDCVFRGHWTHQCSVLTLCSNKRWLLIQIGVRVVNYPHQPLSRFISNWNCKQNPTCKAKHIPQQSCGTVISFCICLTRNCSDISRFI